MCFHETFVSYRHSVCAAKMKTEKDSLTRFFCFSTQIVLKGVDTSSREITGMKNLLFLLPLRANSLLEE